VSLDRLAEQRLRAAEAAGALSGLRGEGAPLGPDGLEGLSGEALQEALVLRAVGAVPPEVAAMRRVEELRVALAGADDAAAARLRAELARAQLEASMLLERSGRVLTAGRYGGA
jgi:hypothetical protein